MYKADFNLRQKAVRFYLQGGVSLKGTALIFDIHYQTVYKWVRQYRQKGEASFFASYRRPWNRTKKDVEQRVISLKENTPSITVKKGQEVLRREGIKISPHAVWSVWKRYGYAGYKKETMGNDFTEYGVWSQEARSEMEQAQRLFDIGEMKKSAEILNGIPFLPKNRLLAKIPDKLLNLRRRVEKAYSLFGKIPLPNYLEMLGNLYKECQTENLHYSTLRAGIPEIMALSWQGKIIDMVKRIEELKQILNNNSLCFSFSSRRRTNLLFDINFTLLIAEGNICVDFLKIKRAYEVAKKCRRLLKKQKCISPNFMIDLGALFLRLEKPKEAEHWYMKALDKVDEEKRKRVKSYLAYHVYFLMGEYLKARKLSKEAASYDWIRRSLPLRFRAMYFLIKGTPQKAISFASESLSKSRKEDLPRDIFNAQLVIAAAYCSLGENITAEKLLATIHNYIAKNQLKIQTAKLEVYQNKDSSISEASVLPTIKLGHLIRNHKYTQAFSYAKRKGILMFFYRYLFFFPDVVIQRIEKGRVTKLPKPILRLPIFNKHALVFHIKFLGNIIVYRNQKYLKVKLQPREKAFLIHCALKLQEPEKSISLERLYGNFWPKSKTPSRNLTHLLVRMRKVLKIPVHLFEVTRTRDRHVLINKGMYFTTDYTEYERNIAQANAFIKIEEWKFARREYLRAFKLFRGEPFKKMYDPWSEHMRRVILNELEAEALHFAKSCLAHGNRADAKRVLEKILKIIPQSEEFAKILQTL